MNVFERPYRPPLMRAASAFEQAVGRVRPDLYELSVEPQLELARRRTGLSDFGDPVFLEGMRVWFSGLAHNQDITPFGHLIHRMRTDWFLTNLLYVQRDLREHPEIAQSRVNPPIFILGLPRTGTTLLHQLLSLDPAHRPLLAYETFRPTTARGPAPRLDGRLAVQRMRWELLRRSCPEFRKIHWVEADEPDECGVLLASTFCAGILDGTAANPEYVQWLRTCDLKPAYSWYRDALKILQYQRNRPRWVLKCPYHLWGLGPILELFEDAKIVWTHRALESVVPSMCSMFGTLRTMHCDNVTARGTGKDVPAPWGFAVQRAMRARDAADPARFTDVFYDELVRDPIGAVRALYARLELPWSDALADRMLRWLRANPQNKHGKHRYSLEQFGLTRQGVSDMFGDYESRFLAGQAPAAAEAV